ncbi:MAG: aminotransferase class I/II-fold pyridoxal phosphate-dependent enzyme [Proteobacteria bacterium]|nr:aminotransferase class I/II-fold pyridoxal phosphate-dependent enzyme [Pseudomonadota bacterium]
MRPRRCTPRSARSWRRSARSSTSRSAIRSSRRTRGSWRPSRAPCPRSASTRRSPARTTGARPAPSGSRGASASRSIRRASCCRARARRRRSSTCHWPSSTRAARAACSSARRLSGLRARGTRFAGGEPWAVELRAEQGYRLEPWELPAAALAETAVLWINYPHNPTGATVDRDYLARLAELCRRHDILLCSDECYVDLYLDGEPPPSLLEVAREGVLVFHSLSKRSGMTGYRAGFIAGDPQLIGALRRARANFGVASSTMVQAAAAWAWRDDAHAAARRALFRRKRELFTRFFAEVGLACAPCSATFYLWLRTPGDADPRRYAAELAERAGILVSPASNLGVEQPYVRLALVPTETDCARAIACWRELIPRSAAP